MKKSVCPVLMVLLLLPSVCLALEYSADRYTTLINDKKNVSKVYYSNDKYRVETGTKEEKSTIIYRLDKKVWWNLLPEKKMYLEWKIADDWFGLAEANQVKPDAKAIGQETVGGQLCDKYKVYPNPEKKNRFVYTWVSRKDKIVMKTLLGDGSYMSELKNLEVGPQPASLFEVPEGYKQVSIKSFF